MRTIACSTGTSIAKGAKFDGNVASYKTLIAEQVRTLRLRHKVGVGTGDAFRREVGAEINSLRALGASADDTVVFLHTDTPDGEVCAQVLAALVEEEFGAHAQLRKIVGLQVANAQDFRRIGVKNLFAELERLEREGHGRLLLNATGGFKSVVPYLTLFGLLRRVPVTYIFEFSEQMITLPAAPVTYDYERVRQALEPLRLVEKHGGITRDEFWRQLGADFSDREYFECLFDDDGACVFPSAFGFLLLNAGTEPGRVLLSREAKEVYEHSRAAVRSQYSFILARIAEPLARQAHVHAFHGTDLNVYKPGNTSERAAYFVRGRDVYVCALAQHDTYQRTFSNLSRALCESRQFTPWALPEGEMTPEPTEMEEMTRIRTDLEAFEQLALLADAEAAKARAESESHRAIAEELGQELAAVKMARDLERRDSERLAATVAAVRAEAEAHRLASEELGREAAARQAGREVERCEQERLAATVRKIDDGSLSMAMRVTGAIARRAVRAVVGWSKRESR